MMQRIDTAIIGGGISGVICSLMSNNAVIFNKKHKDKSTLLSKVLVSGNGRCNFFNEDIYKNLPKNISSDDIKDLFNYFDNNGFAYYKNDKGLYYPFFNKSECFYNFLNHELKKKKIKIIEEDVLKIDYDKKIIYSNNSSYSYNKLVLAFGSPSYYKDKYNYDLIKDLKVDFYPFSPCLCPIKTKEKIPEFLVNNRIKCEVTLLSFDKEIYKEDGEIIFKKDGLSGICIFNSTLFINDELRKKPKAMITIHLNIFKHNNQLTTYDKVKHSLPQFLKDIKINNGELIFTFSSFYSFLDSQISYGGILENEIDESFQLIKRKDVYVIGELIDRNYPCGGYNIGVSLLEGFKLGRLLNGK